MSDMNFDTSRHEGELRDMIARVLFDRDQIKLEMRGFIKRAWGEKVQNREEYIKEWRDEAQAVIDALGLELRRDNLSGNGYRVIGKFIED